MGWDPICDYCGDLDVDHRPPLDCIRHLAGRVRELEAESARRSESEQERLEREGYGDAG